MSKELDEEVSSLLVTVANHFNNEDRMTRERQIRKWRRLKLYWNNFSQVYWSESAKDYRIFGQETNATDSDQSYYDRPVNVFKAFLETIIAALSIQIPAIACVPDDADSPLDLSTAKAGDKIAELIYKHNNVMFLWLNALYIYCTEGMIGCYSYVKEDKEYGTYQKAKFKDEEVESYVCPECQQRIADEVFSDSEMNEFSPDDDDAALHHEILTQGPVCPECGVLLDPALAKQKLIVPRLVGYTDEPKSRICLEAYGGLYIKIANYAKKQCDTPYLIFSYETHYVNPLEMYPDLAKKLPAPSGWSNIGVNDPYEQYGRLNTQYRGEFPIENVTVKNCWLRPASFNILPEEDMKRMKKLFPDGAKVVMVNEVVADYENECLDDCWTLTQNPMSDFLNHDPLGELLTNVQDIVNDLISLTLQTIEHGIPQTWVDPAVVNFDAQRQIEAMPGTLTPTKPLSGSKNLGESFYTTKTASLAPEIFNFYRIVQELGQFVSGALPSLFGGQNNAGSSRTASEYAMSKGMALQRLQTPWKMMTIWWKEIFGKAIPAYIKCIEEDERVVEKSAQGGYVNTFIRKAELDGKIGSIELEPDEKMPITDEQQADMIMQLFQLNNQQIMGALMDPENLPYIKKVIKIPQFRLPGEDDRQKQYEEINILVNSEPIVLPPSNEDIIAAQESGQQIQPNEQSSVEIDPDVDNHEVEASICRSWLIGSAGRLAKQENPAGYKNVLLHMKAHNDIAAQQMQQRQLQELDQQLVAKSTKQTSEGPKASNPEKPKQSEKVSGESSERTPVTS